MPNLAVYTKLNEKYIEKLNIKILNYKKIAKASVNFYLHFS